MNELLENEIRLENIINEEIINDKIHDRGVKIHILRLDRIHAVISGNKYFKLKYYLQEAARKQSIGLISFGGAWSNHILAMAYAAFRSGLKSVGLIRGHPPTHFSVTLRKAIDYGMELKFISRNEFADKSNWIQNIELLYPGYYIIPEGGYGVSGARGAQEILEHANQNDYSHICCACGTGTMLSGIVNGMKQSQLCVGISVLKGPKDQLENDIKSLLQPLSVTKKFSIQNQFHFGGYAKQNQSLFDYMNDLYRRHKIPTDFVYTGKLLYATEKLVEDRFFESGSNILIIHSGGLQGNLSLKPGTLSF